MAIAKPFNPASEEAQKKQRDANKGRAQANNATSPQNSIKQAEQGKKSPEHKQRYHLLTAEQATQGTTLEWKIKQLIPSVGVGQVCGQSKAGKTFILMSLAAALADGDSTWYGFKIKKACPVIYVCLEGEAGFRQRIQALQQYRKEIGKPPLPDNLRFVIYENFAINKTEDVNDLAAICPKDAIVIIDTQNASAPFVVENSSEGIGEIITGAKNLSKQINGFVFLVAHEGLNAQGRPRGSSAQIPAWDTFITVGKSGDTRYWQGTKVKDAEETKKNPFRLSSVDLGYDEDGDPILACVAVPFDSAQLVDKPLTKSVQYALESLKKAIEQNQGRPVNVEKWRPIFYEGHTADKPDSKKKAFDRARNALVERELASVKDDFYSIND